MIAVRSILVACLVLAAPLHAQEQGAALPAHDVVPGAQSADVDIITPHITDADEIDLPYWRAPFYKAWHLPHWPKIHIGKYALDLSPTKHVVMLLVALIVLGFNLSWLPWVG